MGFLKGQIVKEIQLADAKLKLSEGSELNGRQIEWPSDNMDDAKSFQIG